MDKWHKIGLPIEIQFRIYLDLDFLIFAFNNSLGTKKKKRKKKRKDKWCTIRLQLKF